MHEPGRAAGGDVSAHEPGHEHDHEHGGGLRAKLAHFVKPHSHDAADSIDDALEGSREGIRAVKVSLAGLAGTAVLQLVIVAVSGSVALLADTIHNFGDAVTALPLWLAFALSSRAASQKYPYGYGRLEDLAGVFVILMIAASALVAVYESVDRLFRPQAIEHVPWVMAAAIIGFAGNELVARYRIRTGRRIGSAALVADGYHARTDGFTSISVLFGALGAWLGWKWADPLVGLGISVAIVFVLAGACKQMWQRLMDAADPEVTERLRQAAAQVEGAVAVTIIGPRWIGHAMHVEARVTVDRDLSVAEGHRIAEDVETHMMAAVPKLATAIVHVNPCTHDEPESPSGTAIPAV